jgi:hypothetical protein
MAVRRAAVSRDQAMTDEKQDEQRADRDRERSEEAHWQVAEAAAETEAAAEEEKEPPPDTARQPGTHEKEWENEGGAVDRDG